MVNITSSLLKTVAKRAVVMCGGKGIRVQIHLLSALFLYTVKGLILTEIYVF